jgi:hypothetical protein
MLVVPKGEPISVARSKTGAWRAAWSSAELQFPQNKILFKGSRNHR